MTRTKAWSILFIAAVALLGVFLVRESVDRTPEGKVPAVSAEARVSSVETSLPAPDAGGIEPDGGLHAVPGPQAARTPASQPVDEGARVDGELDEATLIKLHGDRPLTTDHPHVKSAIEIQERNDPWLMAHPAVVATGIGLNDKGEVALMILTKADAPELPKEIEGLPVVVSHSGEINARTRLSPQQESNPQGGVTARNHDLTPTAQRFSRPVPIGISTGHPAITAGTIGCRVKTAGGAVFALSNNHVYANQNAATLGDAVIQPGTYDHGVSPADGIGTLSDFVVIKFDGSNNTMDAAIASSTAAFLGRSTPSSGYGTPKSATAAAALNAKVKKVGRTTGLTNGKVYALNATVNVGYDGGTAKFVGQIIVNPGTFSAGGDSGSLIVTHDRSAAKDRKPVALLFAGSVFYTIANPIGPVLTRFGVSVDGE